MISLTYVSRSLVEAADRQSQLADIQAVSISRNSALDLTGLLIATPTHFTQLLEGERAAVDAVMDSIIADQRHGEVRVIKDEDLARRKCPFWRVLPIDQARFSITSITPLLAQLHASPDATASRRLDWLIDRIIASGPRPISRHR